MSWDLVLSDRVANHSLGQAVRVGVGGVPCVETAVVRALENRVHFVLIVQDPWLPFFAAWAWLAGNASKIGVVEVPNDMVPRMGTETRSPELPSCAYETFVLSRLSCKDRGKTGVLAMIDLICFLLSKEVVPIRAIMNHTNKSMV